MQHYVLGFAFDAERERVVLIRKTRPEKQAGKLNGVGGKYEVLDATCERAMQREFFEETNVDILADDWRYIGTMAGSGWRVHCFAVATDRIYGATTMTDEPVSPRSVDSPGTWMEPCMPNLRWLVLLARDALGTDGPNNFTVYYDE